MSEVSGRSPNQKPWWRWLLAPFALVVGLLVLLSLAFMMPFAMVKTWRFERRVTNKLLAEGRVIPSDVAVNELSAEGRTLVAEIGPKGPCNLWLVKHPPTDSEGFAILPTYFEFENDPRRALATLEGIEHSSMKRLNQYLTNALRVEISPQEFKVMSHTLKTSIRTIELWNKHSPSSLLDETLT